MDASSPPDIYLVGDFRLDRRGGGLFRCAEVGGPVPVRIGSRAIELLGVLVERHGDLVSKDELMAAVWPNTVVEENNLTVQITPVRFAELGSSKHRVWIRDFDSSLLGRI